MKVLLKFQDRNMSLKTEDKSYVWFLCFNGISTVFRLFNAKAILLEEQ